jgi:hypothetical protein
MCLWWEKINLQYSVFLAAYSFFFSHFDIHCGFGPKYLMAPNFVVVCSIQGIVLRTKRSYQEHDGVLAVN